ncbi:DUF4199 domain-containing protein [Mangrovimonas cancribranchiae]|uniref:DUF4199 domain-containing protein n=1 Tax=Mangrovimonas cancribranchiae TaxID=3080055 RepID=A0AAU6P7D4_9FLAO
MNSTVAVSFKYGLFTAIMLIAYFLILKLFGLHLNPWFRLFNGVLMAVGIYMAIKLYKLISGASFNYVNGFKTGLLTGFWGTFLFAVFMAIYMFHIDVEFMNTLLKDWFQDMNRGGGILIFIILIEGLASTAVLTLTFMQIFKNSTKLVEN